VRRIPAHVVTEDPRRARLPDGDAAAAEPAHAVVGRPADRRVVRRRVQSQGVLCRLAQPPAVHAQQGAVNFFICFWVFCWF